MTDDRYKHVNFIYYCPICEFCDRHTTDDPCFDCMDEIMRYGTTIPYYFTKKEVHKK